MHSAPPPIAARPSNRTTDSSRTSGGDSSGSPGPTSNTQAEQSEPSSREPGRRAVDENHAPICSRCRTLRTDCIYEAEDSESRWSALRRRNHILVSERADVRELMAYVQSRPEPEACEIFARVRHNSYDDVFKLLRQLMDGELPPLPNALPLTPPTTTMTTDNHHANDMPRHSNTVRLQPFWTMLDGSNKGAGQSPTSKLCPPFLLTTEASRGSPGPRTGNCLHHDLSLFTTLTSTFPPHKGDRTESLPASVTAAKHPLRRLSPRQQNPTPKYLTAVRSGL
ncbi:hypothetical protein LTS01_025304 [Friedmanniomyces endolithicus]|nr:hypothetical protein LTS01_025304 [Friedmanniomyces endolithicus]